MKTANTHSKILSNISWLLSDKVVDIVLKITVGVLVARYLGAEWFGYLNYSLTVIAIVAPLVKFGLGSIVVKHISLHPERAGAVLGTAFFIQLVTAVLLSAGLIFYLNVLSTDRQVTDPMISILAVTLIFQCSDTVVSWNQSQLTSKYTVWANRISIVLGLGFKLLLIKFSAAFSYFVWAWVAESALRAYLLLYFYRKNESFSQWRFDKQLGLELLSKSWPLLFSALSSIVYLKIDVVMLGNMQSGRAVGVYSAAVRISELLYFIPTVVTATLLPTIVRSSKLEHDIFYARIQALLDALALYSILTIAILFFSADMLVLTLFGKDFVEASMVLKIHVFALIFVASGVARNKLLIAENRTIFIMIATAVGAICNVVLNLYLIPLYSGFGAAVATVVSYGISGYLSCLFWEPTIKIFRMISASFFIPFRPMFLVRFVSDLYRSTKKH